MVVPDFSALEKVAVAVDTPFFVYNADVVRHTVGLLQESLKGWGDARIAYSVKTNPLYSLLGTLRESGTWAEVVSIPEFEHALAVGFQPEQIVFNGPLKASGFSPISLGAACINIDSIEEIDRLTLAGEHTDQIIRVGVRVCPPLTAPTWSRFGLNVENGEFEQAMVAIASSKRLKLAGLHAHLGTQVREPNLYLRLVSLMRDLWNTYDIPMDALLDIGGGFAFKHDNLEPQIPSRDFFASLADAWGQDRPCLVIEPGRIIAGPSMTLVCRVLTRKKRPREPDILVLDGGTNHNVMGAFFEHAWTFADVDNEVANYRLCGPLCMEDDLMSEPRSGQIPRVGTLAVMHNSGAYSFTLARNFIQGVPPVIESRENSFTMIAGRSHLKQVYGRCTNASQMRIQL